MVAILLGCVAQTMLDFVALQNIRDIWKNTHLIIDAFIGKTTYKNQYQLNEWMFFWLEWWKGGKRLVQMLVHLMAVQTAILFIQTITWYWRWILIVPRPFRQPPYRFGMHFWRYNVHCISTHRKKKHGYYWWFKTHVSFITLRKMINEIDIIRYLIGSIERIQGFGLTTDWLVEQPIIKINIYRRFSLNFFYSHIHHIINIPFFCRTNGLNSKFIAENVQCER